VRLQRTSEHPSHAHTEFQNVHFLCWQAHLHLTFWIPTYHYISEDKFPLLNAFSKATLGPMSWILFSEVHFLMEWVLGILFQARLFAKYGQMSEGFFSPHFLLHSRLPKTSNPFTSLARVEQMVAVGMISRMEPVHTFWSQVTETSEVLQQVYACVVAQLPNMVMSTLARKV
jgi:hypothetical protein